MQKLYTTRQVAQCLGVRPDKIQREIWLGTIRQPNKISNRFLWTVQDIERAAWSLKCYSRFAQWSKRGQNV